MNRAWNKQRKFKLLSKHRKALNRRYHPPSFQTDTRLGTYWSKSSEFGYQMAKGIYWSHRHQPPVFCEYAGIVFQGPL